jgi:hypothetical protein
MKQKSITIHPKLVYAKKSKIALAEREHKARMFNFAGSQQSPRLDT